jgi:hypothetical protein
MLMQPMLYLTSGRFCLLNEPYNRQNINRNINRISESKNFISHTKDDKLAEQIFEFVV